MGILKQIDWQMISFVGFSLASEYLSHIYLPRIEYWNWEK